MAKLAPRDLAQVLSRLPKQNEPRIVVGFENADDAGVFRLDDEVSLVQTLDFFTPVTDDPEEYGRIAAVNSLNDVYAMGGKPITALSIVGFPQTGDFSILGSILKGGMEAMIEEGVAVLGGHSIDDQEIKFGYSVTGIVSTNNVITNAGSQPGDDLILTKPIGTGVISTAIKNGIASEEAAKASSKAMTRSGREAALAMTEVGVNACTDITGFGLLGHAYEMAKASNVTFRLEAEAVPLLPDVFELVERKMLTRGDRNNRDYVGETVMFDAQVTPTMQSILFDPQTAGGLLISVSRPKSEQLLGMIAGSVRIGSVESSSGNLIVVA